MKETRSQRLNRQSEAFTDRELLDHYSAADERGDKLATRIFMDEIDHRDCWR